MVDIGKVEAGAEGAADALDALNEAGVKTGQVSKWTRVFSTLLRLFRKG